jgi:multidrug efflux pump subunit AcrA (membrane-fusion protein)
VLEASLNETKAMLQVASNNLDRAQKLFAKGWITKAQLDDAVAQHDRNQATVVEAEKRINAAKLPGRSDMIDAAKANAEAAHHALHEAEKNLGKLRVGGWHGGGGLFQARRGGECRPGRGGASAAAQSQGSLLRGRTGACQAPNRPECHSHLRRLPARSSCQDQFHRARG